MHNKKIKRKRPNLETAHEWLQSGMFSIIPDEHYLSDEEAEEEVENIVNELEDMSRQFPRTQNLEYAVLKSHLILEHVIFQYIRFHARVAVDPKDIRFTFSQKLEIAYLMGFGANDPILLPGIQLLNKARNQVAHSFLLDRAVIDELIRINDSPVEPFQIENDRHRISGLRNICKWVCAYTAGRLEAEYVMSKVEHERRKAGGPAATTT